MAKNIIIKKVTQKVKIFRNILCIILVIFFLQLYLNTYNQLLIIKIIIIHFFCLGCKYANHEQHNQSI